MIPFSVLDLAPITAGSDAAQAFRNTLDLAQLAERLGVSVPRAHQIVQAGESARRDAGEGKPSS